MAGTKSKLQLPCGDVGKACNAMCSSAPRHIHTSPSGEPTNSPQVTKQLGIFDIFKVGIGPSSSHTVGPMVAGFRFIGELRAEGILKDVENIRCDFFGSLALTGVGHGSDKAVCVGLAGKEPAGVDPDEADLIFERVKKDGKVHLANERDIVFTEDDHIVMHFDAEMPQHPNGMRLAAFDKQGVEMYSNEYLSLGGGFIQSVSEFEGVEDEAPSPASTRASSTEGLSEDDSCSTSGTPTNKAAVPYPFKSASQLLRICKEHNITIAELMMANEQVLLGNCDTADVEKRLDGIWEVMSECIDRGKKNDGTMPVSGMTRMAPSIYKQLKKDHHRSLADHFAIMDWISLFARCVNEENACGGRIVTSPTNGASGTIPAVLAYYAKFFHRTTKKGIRTFLATAAAFGVLLKTNASISGAEAGCQAEVGSACAMAAAGLTAVMGGTLEQIENAAEIGLEHNLGMTCDPLQGLVQVPCIERNCVAAIKAITAHRLAIRGDGRHEVSFDSCVETMYRTGLDMQAKYRETSTGGLALYARRPDNFEKGQAIREKLCKESPVPTPAITPLPSAR